uniref:DUF218 domain-containing protein n=1 Tax=Desulfobacca acetoxidans TaxID=60893 RepID=A0A7V6DP55_9BACT
MFLVKKIVGLITDPATLVLLLLACGFGGLLLTRNPRKRGLGWIALGLLGFYLFTTAPLPNFLLKTLERRYQPLTNSQKFPDIRYIVVLSGGMRFNNAVPPTSRLDASSSLRVAEGIRLFHLFSGAPALIMTGAGPWGDLGSRMAAFAASLGIPAAKLIPENHAKDTYGNAKEVQPLVTNEPFLLVTSAVHMPRAMLIFQKLGMKPIPAPADFRYSPHYFYEDFFPSGNNLSDMEAVTHEYLGLAYLYLFPGRAGK